jgi:hypothetical protein
MNGKAVVMGLANHLSSNTIKRNDVIIAADELDARNATFQNFVDKFRWVPRVGDWCGLQAGPEAAAEHAHAHSKGGAEHYMHMTTPEQDIVASYPVKLSRVEDTVCLLLARPTLPSNIVSAIVHI